MCRFARGNAPTALFTPKPPTGALVNRYVQALITEMELVAADLQPQTVFFGGGTPSLLNLRQWEAIFKAMERLRLLGAAEWTVECNPATVSADKARLLRDWGVNRVSMGAQSFDAGLLERLGRVHSREMIFKSFDILRAAGFDNVNLDLMFAIPGQTMETWRATLAEALALGSEHLACYEVIYEEDTPLVRPVAGRQNPAPMKTWPARCMTNFWRRRTRRASSNTKWPTSRAAAAGGANCRTGPAAIMSTIGGAAGSTAWGPARRVTPRPPRTRNMANTTLYCEQLERGRRARWQSSEELPPLARAGELAAFGLRMTAGWPLESSSSAPALTCNASGRRKSSG